jgi:alpha-glucosidase
MLDEYGAIFTVAEVGGDQAIHEMKAYTAGDDHLNSAYGFDFLYAEQLTPAVVTAALAEWPDEPGMGWPSWAFANHDAPRWISRWAPADARDAFARVTLLLFVALRGNIILWQGEELGLTQVDIPFERLQDPEAIANWPLTLSRDGARTPMVWNDNAPHGGFSHAEPWLPVGEDHALLAVARQDGDPASLLNYTRRLVGLRQSQAALRLGALDIVTAQGDLLVFTRTWEGETLLCAFNLGGQTLDWRAPAGTSWAPVDSTGEASLTSLPPYAGLIAKGGQA